MPRDINSGISAYKSNNKKLATEIFIDLVKENPKNEKAWLWLAACVSKTEEKIVCLNNAISINPKNIDAKNAVAKLEKEVAEQKTPGFDFSMIHPQGIINLPTPTNFKKENADSPKEKNVTPGKVPKKKSSLLAVFVVIICIVLLGIIVVVAFPQIGQQVTSLFPSAQSNKPTCDSRGLKALLDDAINLGNVSTSMQPTVDDGFSLIINASRPYLDDAIKIEVSDCAFHFKNLMVSALTAQIESLVQFNSGSQQVGFQKLEESGALAVQASEEMHRLQLCMPNCQ